MRAQHLSDEAVAACADGVLSGHARDRAMRHVHECAECAEAVRVQREAVFALRAAPAPALPAGLASRLLSVPQTTAIDMLPTAIDDDGTPLLATFAPVAAFVPAAPRAPRSSALHRAKPFVASAAVAALAGTLIAGSVAHDAAAEQNVRGNSAGEHHPATVSAVHRLDGSRR